MKESKRFQEDLDNSRKPVICLLFDADVYQKSFIEYFTSPRPKFGIYIMNNLNLL